jgi:GNAT superfamily N-acetyltransferase
MPAQVVVRKAKPNELRAVQDLNHELFEWDTRHADLLKNTWAYEEGESYFKGMIDGVIGVCFVAEVSGILVGYLVGSIQTAESYRPIQRAELENMFVRQEYRGRGIGTALIKTFLSWSLEAGMPRVFVSSFASNTAAQGFYKKNGFEPYSIELEMKLD